MMLKLLTARLLIRGSFLIDTNGVVRHQVVNDLPLGRNVDEMIRMVDALLFHEEHGEVCPAGWNKGDAGCKQVLKVLLLTFQKTKVNYNSFKIVI